MRYIQTGIRMALEMCTKMEILLQGVHLEMAYLLGSISYLFAVVSLLNCDGSEICIGKQAVF